MKISKAAIFILAFSIFLFVVSAQEQSSLGVFQRDSCVDLKQTCTNCSYVNITTVILPDASEALGQVEMQKTGTVYNYTFCNTSQIGQYVYWTIGDPDGTQSNPYGVSFVITKTGQIFENSFSVPLLLPILFILLTSAFFLFMAFRVNFQSAKTVLIGLAGVFLLFGIIYSLNITNDVLTGFDSITGGFGVFYRIILIITWLIFFLLVAYLLVMSAERIKKIRGMK